MKTELETYAFEVSYGLQWVNLNDHQRFIIAGDAMANRAKSFRQTKATSQITEGDVLIHSVAEMVAETVKVQAYGYDQADLEDNIATLEALFEQFSYQVRVTKNNFREIWTCQASPNITIEAGQVYLHNMMGIVTAVVPRQPTMTRERLPS